MTPELSKRWSKLVHMRWDELHTRIGQEASKRLELAAYRLGLQSTRNGLARGPNAAQGAFFFSPRELVERTALLQEYLSSEVSAVISEADGILRHRFQLLGYANVDYGPEIDWHLDAVHGKRAPLKPWFNIHFLDFSEVGDHKITWELNRHQHLVTLARAWCFTHNNEYVDELNRQWYGWQVANPYPMGINWSSSLEVAFRSLSWLWVDHLLSDCARVPANFKTDLLRALVLNARYIERYLSTYFSPNTHLLGEAVALFFVGTLCPAVESAKRWRDLGWGILLAEAQRQVHPDGVYFEQSLYYHVYALDFLLHARLLAARNQFDVPDSFDMVLQKMLNVLSGVAQTGVPDGFGDDDGGRVFNPRRNRSEHLTDPLAVGALVFGRTDLQRSAKLTEESIWLFGDVAVSALAESAHPDQKLKSVAFESGGIYVMASSADYAGQIVIDAGPQGTANSGHGHADALGIQVSLDGRRWLVDAGTYSYVSEDRDRFRGTSAHNTLRVNGADQAIPAGPFAWSAIPSVHAETWIAGETFDLFAGSHSGYSRLSDPVIHRRFVFHLHGAFWLVRDVAEGRDYHDLETFWHFAPDLTVTKGDDILIAALTQAPPEKSGMRLVLLPVEAPDWTSEISPGFVSPAYGRKYSAPVVRCSARAKLPAEHAVLLRPVASSVTKFGKLVYVSAQDSGARAYRYDESGKSHFMVFAGPEKTRWTCSGFSSDARFLYACFEDGRLTHFILCQGISVQFQGRPIIAHSLQIERFEWLIRGGLPEIHASDEAVKNSLSGNVIEVFG